MYLKHSILNLLFIIFLNIDTSKIKTQSVDVFFFFATLLIVWNLRIFYELR